MSESVSQEAQGKVPLDSWEETRTSFIVPKYLGSRLSGKGKLISQCWSESHLHNLSACLQGHWIILRVEIQLKDPS